MVKCPDPNCRESLLKEINDKTNTMKKCVSDEMKNVIGSLSSRPKTRTLLVAIGILVTVGIAAGTWIYAGYSNAQDAQDERLTIHTHYRETSQQQIHELNTHIELIERDVSTIARRTQQSEDIQIQMLKILQKMNSNNNDDDRRH